MDIKQQIDQDLIQAQKEKNETAVMVLRGVKTALTNSEISNDRQELSNDGIIKILKSEVKRRKEAAELYAQGGRQELVAKENAEIEVIAKYLPAELSEDEIKKKISEVIAKTGASSPTDIGKVMGAVMADLGAAADGSVVSKLVKELLA